MSDDTLLPAEQLLLAWTQISTTALLCILLLRALLLRHGSATLAYASWLLLPLALATSLLPHPGAAPLAAPLAPAQLAAPNGGTMAISPIATAASGTPWPGAATWLGLWLLGALLTTAWMAWQQRRFAHQLGPLRNTAQAGVLQATSSAGGPLLMGLLRPCIVLPADFAHRYTEQEQALILAHERVHLRRGDLLVNALAALMQIVFWFNPLVHYCAGRFRFDQELACDSAVLRQHPQARQSYAATILKAQLASGSLALACHWQQRHPLQARIRQLAQAAPQRARRAMLQGLLGGLALTGGYCAWAATSIITLTATPVATTVPAAPMPLSVSADAHTQPLAATAPASAQPKVRPLVVAAVTAARSAATEPASAATAQAEKPAADTPVAISPPAAGSAGRYKLAYTFTRERPGQAPISNQMEFAIPGDGHTDIRFTAENALNCEFGFELRARPDDMVEIKSPLRCGDQGTPFTPRLITRLGDKATVEFGGTPPEGGTAYRLVMTVTRWPEGRPWPIKTTAGPHTITVSTARPPPATGSYSVNFTHQLLMFGDDDKQKKSNTTRMSFFAGPKQRVTFSTNNDGKACHIDLEVKPDQENAVELQMDIQCEDPDNGIYGSKPRLVAQLGGTATVSIKHGKDLVHVFNLQITQPAT
jgi:beta-lactamase regulating signal transducer with metallopeptidase domain